MAEAAEDAGQAGRLLRDAEEGCPGGVLCLAPGTPVWLADGTTEAIEDVRPGDVVSSRDPATGRDEAREVTATYARPADALVTLSLSEAPSGQAGGQAASPLVCTPEHPLWVAGRGWAEAGSLSVGDRVLARDGQALSVTAIKWQRAKDGQAFTVYNLTVRGDHTYFAGKDHGGVWAHNCGENPGEYLAKKAPMQVTPGTKVLEGQYVDGLGRVQPWRAHYDEYGRLIGRTDYNAANKVQGYASTHYHTYGYQGGRQGGTWAETGSHIPGEFKP